MALFKTLAQKKAELQDRIDRRKGRTPSPPISSPGGKKELNWLGISAKVLISIAVLILLGLLFGYWRGLFNAVGNAWSWAASPETVLSRLIPFLILFGTIFFVLRLAGDGKLVKAARNVALALIVVAIGISLFVWHQGTPLYSGELIASRAECPPFTPDETRSCVLTEKWSRPITVDRLTAENEYSFCIYVPPGGVREQELVGPNTYVYRSGKGALPIRYRLFPGECPEIL